MNKAWEDFFKLNWWQKILCVLFITVVTVLIYAMEALFLGWVYSSVAQAHGWVGMPFQAMFGLVMLYHWVLFNLGCIIDNSKENK